MDARVQMSERPGIAGYGAYRLAIQRADAGES